MNLQLLDRQLSEMGTKSDFWLKQAVTFKLAQPEPKNGTDASENIHRFKHERSAADLPDYKPSEKMLHALANNFTDAELIDKDAIFEHYLSTEKLEFYNASSVMLKLLTIEDVSTMKLYSQLIEPNVVIHKTKGNMFKAALTSSASVNAEEVVSPGIDEVVLIPKRSLISSPLPKELILALIPHPHEILPLQNPTRRFVASVEQVSRTSVHFKFGHRGIPDDIEWLSQRYHVILRSTRIPIRCMYRALNKLTEMPGLRRYLFPFPDWLTTMIATSQIELHDCKLPTWMQIGPTPPPAPPAEICLLNRTISDNKEQLDAVRRIVAGPSSKAPFIVFGPPGTGKTTTIVESILQLRLKKPQSRILVAAGSNSACDTIAIKLCEYITDNLLLVQHQHLLGYRPLIRIYSRTIFKKGLKSVPPLLLNNSNCSGHVYEHLKIGKVMEYSIIVATLVTVGRLAYTGFGNFFTHIFIDEAGATTEPETLMGIVDVKQSNDCHVILSGDYKQLGAVIKSGRAGSLGLNHSLMERLLTGSDCYKLDENGNYDRTLQIRLRRNYRSHPEIVRLFNELYYDGELIAQAADAQVNVAAEWDVLPNGKFPIIFQAAHGVTKRDEHTTSSFNYLEAQVLCWYVKRLLKHGLGPNVAVKQEDIGVVAPYTSQGSLICRVLEQQGFGSVEVGSVETYQGREKLIIIATLVRSFSSMGFMSNPRRINVLISRAKALLILIGNPVTLRHNHDFKFIIDECIKHQTYLFKKKSPSFTHSDDGTKENTANPHNATLKAKKVMSGMVGPSLCPICATMNGLKIS
ncbi:putative helicase mov-10-B.1 [Drosophila guanche]|uniref:Blast:Putative helicase mov-10-B.1 n=1 Tax=Drosophila guanche TaxID=7266 RepID=A0A3B0JK35_DROGU|nr:putative helicase mov-10-B.1 [Drosophila guanche]SPP73606.1 blast:Putative helicase mov-10-B.1 [Drosophila guanche]